MSPPLPATFSATPPRFPHIPHGKEHTPDLSSTARPATGVSPPIRAYVPPYRPLEPFRVNAPMRRRFCFRNPHPRTHKRNPSPLDFSFPRPELQTSEQISNEQLQVIPSPLISENTAPPRPERYPSPPSPERVSGPMCSEPKAVDA